MLLVNGIYHNMLSQFSKRLKEERNRLGMNQEDFAIAGGVTKNTQVAYEAGARPPDVEYLFKIADLGVDLFFLLAREKDWTGLAPEVTELITVFKGLGPSQQALSFAMMTLFAGAPAEKTATAQDIWRSARMLRGFMAATDDEKAIVEHTLATLRVEGEN